MTPDLLRNVRRFQGFHTIWNSKGESKRRRKISICLAASGYQQNIKVLIASRLEIATIGVFQRILEVEKLLG
jgi:hypothetical protein